MDELFRKRTIWSVKCACGWQREWVNNTPKSTQCPRCKTWHDPKEESYTGKDEFGK